MEVEAVPTTEKVSSVLFTSPTSYLEQRERGVGLDTFSKSHGAWRRAKHGPYPSISNRRVVVRPASINGLDMGGHARNAAVWVVPRLTMTPQ